MKVKLYRFWQDKNQSTGAISVLNDEGQPILILPCIERGDRNNERNVSCIPSGEYDLVLEWSPRFQRKLWELKGVPNRSECKIHASNYWHQLNGCIAPGMEFNSDINKDGYYDVTQSKVGLRAFHKALKGETKIKIEVI